MDKSTGKSKPVFTKKKVEPSQSQNSEEIPATRRLESSDTLFVGCDRGSLLQLSIRQKKMIKDYGEIMDMDILISTRTADNKHLFLGDKSGR